MKDFFDLIRDLFKGLFDLIRDLYRIYRSTKRHRIAGILVIGGIGLLSTNLLQLIAEYVLKTQFQIQYSIDPTYLGIGLILGGVTWAVVETLLEHHRGKASDKPSTYTLNEIMRGAERLTTIASIEQVAPSDWIDRPEENQIQAFLQSKEGKVLCLLGEPGCGKTSLMGRLVHRVRHLDCIIAIKADRLPTHESFKDWARNVTKLELSPVEAIKEVASSRRVLVVVDQMDAVASLTDVQSSRLNDLINFIREIAQIENVKVVASCRTVEFRRDTRFSVIDATSIDLLLPSWEEIVPKLAAAGVERWDGWPDDVKESLRNPQHLTLFLERVKETADQTPFDSYQLMLDDLWERKVKVAEDQRLIDKMATDFLEAETTHMPSAKYRDASDSVTRMVAAGLLRRVGSSLEFAHQTFLEHARARHFAAESHSFTKHVVDHENSILIRPTLWSVLTYLRGSRSPNYQSELNSLFEQVTRLHVKFLLLDFLGQLDEPYDYEVAHFFACVSSEELRAHALAAIHGKKNWLKSITGLLPTYMQGSQSDRWHALQIINASWNIDQETCLRLVKAHWFPSTEYDQYILLSLRESSQWTDELADMVCAVIQRSAEVVRDGQRSYVLEDLTYVISNSAPTLAPRICAASLKKQMESGQRDLLKSRGEWYELPGVAEAAPIEFLVHIWPIFVELCSREDRHDSSLLNRYLGSTAWEFDLGEGHSLLDSIQDAASRVATSNPEDFVDTTHQSWTCDSLQVHAVVTSALSKAVTAGSLIEVACEYLMSDNRRYLMGEFRNRRKYTIGLLEALVSQVNPDQLRRIVESVASYSQYKPGAILEVAHDEYDAAARIELFSVIPNDLLSSDDLRRIEADSERAKTAIEEARAVAAFESRQRSQDIEQPPLSSDEMSNVTDEEILNVFDDANESERFSGSYASAEELSKYAKEDPQRAINIVLDLIRRRKEKPAGEVVRSLDETDLTPEQLFECVRQIASVQPRSVQLRSNVGALVYRLSALGEVPDDVCDVLKEWLLVSSDDSETLFGADSSVEIEGDKSRSILFGTAPREILDVDLSFWPLVGMSRGMVVRKEPKFDAWCDTIRQLSKGAISTRTWENAFEIPILRRKELDAANLADILTAVLQAHPSVGLTVRWIRLVGNLAYKLPSKFVESFLEQLKQNGSCHGYQAYGELLTWLAIHEPGRYEDMLRSEFTLMSSHADEHTEAFWVGVAFVSAKLWDDRPRRELASDFLIRCCSQNSEAVGNAISTVFWAAEDFPPDAITEGLLEAITQSPSLVQGRFVYDLVEHLVQLLPYAKIGVLEVAFKIVEFHSYDLGSAATSVSMAAPHLVSISMTLQRYPETQKRALTLFEKLLQLGLSEAKATIDEIDLRPHSRSIRTSRKPRRRRRKPPFKPPN